MNTSAAAACVIFLCGIIAADAQEPGEKTTAAGVFTQQQATSGEAAYNANCAGCHGTELRSSDREIPHLTEKSFQFGWVGKTVAERFEAVRDAMPPKEPRSLPDQVYLDIVAYILHFNKAPAGPERLEPDLQKLNRIVIAAPPN